MDHEVYILAPIWIPPADCEWFDLVGGSNVDKTSAVTLASLTLPVDQRGIIRWFGQDIPNKDKVDSIVWRIKINGGPDKVYGTVQGLISEFKSPTDILIRIPKGGTVELTAETTDVDTIYCAGRLKGWYWRMKDHGSNSN